MVKAERLAMYVRRSGPGLLFPSNATDVNVHDLYKLKAQGLSGEMYSFSVAYSSEGMEYRTAFILRMYKRHAEKNGPVEYATLRTLEERNIPVPSAYALEMNKKIIGKPFMIMEKIAGVSASHFFSDEEEALVTVDKLAKTLTLIHKLDPACLHYCKLPQKRHEFAQCKLSEIKNFINVGRIVSLAPFRQRRYLESVKQLEKVMTELCLHNAIIHGDYGPDHVLVTNGRFVIVDLGGVCVGDPAWDVGYTYHILKLDGQNVIDHTFVKLEEQNMIKVNLGEHFVERYEKYMGQKLVNLEFYKDVAALRLAVLFDLYIRPSIFSIPRSFLFLGLRRTFNRILFTRSIKSFQDYLFQFLESRGILR